MQETDYSNSSALFKQIAKNMPKYTTYPPNIGAAVNANDEFLLGWWRFLPSPSDEKEEKIMRAIVQETKNRHIYKVGSSNNYNKFQSKPTSNYNKFQPKSGNNTN